MTDKYIGRGDYYAGRQGGKQVGLLIITPTSPIAARDMHPRIGGYLLGADRAPTLCNITPQGMLIEARFTVHGKRDAAKLCKLVNAERYNF